MFILLMLGSGIFWSITYLLIIRRGILDQTYGMPFFALCANISWEFIFSFIYPPTSIIQYVIHLVWFFLDVVILIQFLRYGPREFAILPKWVFYIGFGLALITSFFTILLITWAVNDQNTYTAFGQNLMMSVLFIGMLYQRRNLRGQSISIAVSKLLGTALASLALFLFDSQSALLVFLYIAIFVYDVIYVGLIVYVQWRASVKAVDAHAAVGGEVESVG